MDSRVIFSLFCRIVTPVSSSITSDTVIEPICFSKTCAEGDFNSTISLKSFNISSSVEKPRAFRNTVDNTFFLLSI